MDVEIGDGSMACRYQSSRRGCGDEAGMARHSPHSMCTMPRRIATLTADVRSLTLSLAKMFLI